MKQRRCVNCGCALTGPFRNPDQKYCSATACQRARKRRWQRDKMATDADYRANQRAAQRSWRERNRQYSRNYRQNHPDYVEQNRARQSQRNQNRRIRSSVQQIAKMDAFELVDTINSGTYKLVPVGDQAIAKMDALNVQLVVFACLSDPFGPIAKKDLIV
jgi:hypothetical protein